MPDNAISREQDLFCDCLDLTPEQRAQWLHDVCGDDEALRQRVERLLNAHDEAERFSIPEAWSEPTEVLPEWIDGYRILRVAGEGGMGVVYEAWQEEPVRRRVALKAVKPGMDTRHVLARFRSERQALAAMDHPYLAKVFDAGETASGRPYFVMEFVDGIPLLEYCEKHSLTFHERIELFVLVCQAVQHAHHKGVIHRDLKPGNILVTSEFGSPLPKIIDFGIARAVSPEDREGVTHTVAGLRAGTPAYMSPEQAGRGGLDIDTRSDVYSLGVILYELLTGTLPADPAGVPVAEFLRALALGEVKIVRPSGRPQLPGPTKKQLAGDLDWIVMKALEADRERRYPTPLEVSEDLRRYLTARPVNARPPALSYQLRKFVRRHRVPMAAATVALVAILAGMVAGGLGLMRARKAEAVARQEAAAARQVTNFLARLFTTSDPNATPGSPVTVRQVLDEGTRRVQTELHNMPEAKAMLMGTLSHVHDSLGSYRQARDLAEQALATRPSGEDLETAKTLMSLARANQRLDDFDAALKAVQRALDIRIRLLGEDDIEVGTSLNHLGSLYGQLERFEEAIAAHRRALAIQEKAKGADHIAVYNSWRGLGIVYDRQGNHMAALECFQRVVPIARKRYGDSHPVVADALQNVAMVLREMKRASEAQELYRQALDMQRKLLGPDHPEVAFNAHGLAAALRDQGKLKESEALFAEAVRIRNLKLGGNNVRTGESLKNLGLVRIRLGRVEEGKQLLAQAVGNLEKAYGPEHTDVLDCHRDAALTLVEAGRFVDAIPHLRRVAFPKIPARFRVDLGDTAFDRMRESRIFRDLQNEVMAAAAY